MPSAFPLHPFASQRDNSVLTSALISFQTVFGELIALEDNSDVMGMAVFILNRLLWNPDIAAEYRHPSVPHLYRDGEQFCPHPERRNGFFQASCLCVRVPARETNVKRVLYPSPPPPPPAVPIVSSTPTVIFACLLSLPTVALHGL